MKNSILLFFIFLIIYILGSFSRVPFGDCIGFVTDVEKGAFITTATPLSHIFYTNFTVLISKIFSLGGIFSSRIVVIGAAAATVSVIYLTARIIVKSDWISIICAIIFGLSFTFWRNAEIVEVYTFSSFWVSIYLYFGIKSLLEHRPNLSILAAFFLGLSLWAHIQNILLIPSLLILLFFIKERKSTIYSILAFSALFLGLFALNTSQGLPLKSIWSSDQGHWVEDSFKKPLLDYAKDLVKSVFYLVYNFNFFVWFGIIGAVQLYKRQRKLFWFAFSAAFFVFGFATFYAVSDNYVFFLPANIIFALGIGYGLRHYSKKSNLKKVSPLVALIPVFYLGCYFVASNIPQAQKVEKEKGYKGGLKYYLVPWMNDNVGILEFTVDKKVAPEPINWMTISAKEFINLKLKQGYTLKEIKKM